MAVGSGAGNLPWILQGGPGPAQGVGQDHTAGLRPRCGKTIMQRENEALRNDMLAKTPNCLQMPVV